MKKILVVDDVQLICTLCQNVFSKAGFEVVTQPSGARCIAYLKNKGRSAVDLLILDVEMPYMSGFETLGSVRAINGMSDLPVIFLTSACTKETVSQAIKLGAKDYIKKPFDSDELLRRVNKILYLDAAPAEAGKPAIPENTDEREEADAAKVEGSEEALQSEEAPQADASLSDGGKE